jgi:hypothetical protein
MQDMCGFKYIKHNKSRYMTGRREDKKIVVKFFMSTKINKGIKGVYNYRNVNEDPELIALPFGKFKQNYLIYDLFFLVVQKLQSW